jgi:hypothetical protein
MPRRRGDAVARWCAGSCCASSCAPVVAPSVLSWPPTLSSGRRQDLEPWTSLKRSAMAIRGSPSRRRHSLNSTTRNFWPQLINGAPIGAVGRRPATSGRPCLRDAAAGSCSYPLQRIGPSSQPSSVPLWNVASRLPASLSLWLGQIGTCADTRHGENGDPRGKVRRSIW